MTSSPPRRGLVTGATGLVGRHVAETLASRGTSVRAVVRRPEAAAALAAAGIEVVPGDLLDRASLVAAMAGVDVVIHAAAQVDEWGARQVFVDANVRGMENLLAAVETAGVGRLVHVSSVMVYGLQRGRIDELRPYRPTGDPYSDTKIAAEERLWERHRAGAIAATCVRPSLVYGPYDRKFVPKIAEGLLGAGVPLIGGGGHRAEVVSVRDVVDLILLCAERAEAVGEAFNCSAEEGLCWREVFGEIARQVGAPPPRMKLPYSIAYAAGAVLETAYRLAGSRRPPLITRYGATLVGYPFEYDTSKARRILGFVAGRPFAATLPEALAWWRREMSGKPAAR